jgi:hypothetical protein
VKWTGDAQSARRSSSDIHVRLLLGQRAGARGGRAPTVRAGATEPLHRFTTILRAVYLSATSAITTGGRRVLITDRANSSKGVGTGSQPPDMAEAVLRIDRGSDAPASQRATQEAGRELTCLTRSRSRETYPLLPVDAETGSCSRASPPPSWRPAAASAAMTPGSPRPLCGTAPA